MATRSRARKGPEVPPTYIEISIPPKMPVDPSFENQVHVDADGQRKAEVAVPWYADIDKIDMLTLKHERNGAGYTQNFLPFSSDNLAWSATIDDEAQALLDARDQVRGKGPAGPQWPSDPAICATYVDAMKKVEDKSIIQPGALIPPEYQQGALAHARADVHNYALAQTGRHIEQGAEFKDGTPPVQVGASCYYLDGQVLRDYQTPGPDGKPVDIQGPAIDDYRAAQQAVQDAKNMSRKERSDFFNQNGRWPNNRTASPEVRGALYDAGVQLNEAVGPYRAAIEANVADLKAKGAIQLVQGVTKSEMATLTKQNQQERQQQSGGMGFGIVGGSKPKTGGAADGQGFGL